MEAFINKKIFMFCLFSFLLGCSCDPEGREECVWTLEPEPDLIAKTEAGYIPVCARNRETMKQDCRLQVTMKMAKEYFGKKFKYVDLKVESPALPRRIVSIKFCEQEKSDTK